VKTKNTRKISVDPALIRHTLTSGKKCKKWFVVKLNQTYGACPWKKIGYFNLFWFKREKPEFTEILTSSNKALTI
jgi:hypothetical protein